MRSLRLVLPLVAGMLFAGQGVTAAATPIAKTAFVPGEANQGDGEHPGNGESSGDDESKGDDGGPGAGAITGLPPTGVPGAAAIAGPPPTGPPPTGAPAPAQQTLTRSVATSRTNSVLSRRFGPVYTHADHKRVSCRPEAAGSYVCSLSWRYRQKRYDGRAIVSPSGLVKTHVVSRRR
jgi:hypothetical protein